MEEEKRILAFHHVLCLPIPRNHVLHGSCETSVKTLFQESEHYRKNELSISPTNNCTTRIPSSSISTITFNSSTSSSRPTINLIHFSFKDTSLLKRGATSSINLSSYPQKLEPPSESHILVSSSKKSKKRQRLVSTVHCSIG